MMRNCYDISLLAHSDSLRVLGVILFINAEFSPFSSLGFFQLPSGKQYMHFFTMQIIYVFWYFSYS